MYKIVFGVVVLVVCAFVIVFLIIGAPEEPDAVKILQEKGYSDIEIIDKEMRGVRDQNTGISSSTTVFTIRAISPKGESVRIKFSYSYPMDTEPIIKME